MAWNVQKFQQLADLLITLSGQGSNIDVESQNYKKAERLITQLFNTSERSRIANISLSEILDDMERRKDLIEKRKSVYLEEDEARRAIVNANRRAEEMIRQKIKILLTSEEYSEQELADLREEFELLRKTNKKAQEYDEGLKKGAAIAESILQSTLGISKNTVNVMGGIKGFGKGLKKSVNAANIMATLVTRALEIFSSVDGAAANLFKNQGTDRFKKDVLSVGTDLSLAFTTSDSAAAEMIGELRNTQKTFDTQSREEVRNAARTAGKLSAMGVSVSAYADLGKFMRANLGQHILEQNRTLGKFYDLAKSTEMSPEQVFREVAESIPVYSRYGRQFSDVVIGMQHAAKRTNMKMADLVTLTESFDQSENAYRQAQKFNALLGGNFLNPAALLSATPHEKVRLIAEAYQSAQRKIGDIHPDIVRSLYSNFNMDAQQFNNIVNANFEDFDGEISKTVSGTPNLMKKLNDDIKKSLSVGDALERSLATMFRAVLKDLIPHIMKIANFAIELFKIILRFSPAGMLLSILDGSALQLFKDVTGITAKEEKQKEKEEEKRQENFSHDMLAGQMLEDEDGVSRFLNSLQDVSAVGPTMVSAGAADPMEIAAAHVLDLHDQAEYAKQEEQQRYVESRRTGIAQSMAASKMGAFNDSPVAMSTTNASMMDLLPAGVPVVDAKMETSDKDDVLIGRLLKLRDKLQEYGSKQIKTSINVSGRSIGEVVT